MENFVKRCVTKPNVLIILYLLVLWASASSALQFRTTANISKEFPGTASQWYVRGDKENVTVSTAAVGIAPVSKARAVVGSAYDLQQRDSDAMQFLLVNSTIITSTDGYHNATASETNDSQMSLLNAWFGDQDNQRFHVMTIVDLPDIDQQVETSKILAIPENAQNVNINLLLRRFEAKHDLVALEVYQIERTRIYKVILSCLLIIGMATLLLALKSVYSKLSLPSIIVTSAVALILCIGVLMPAKLLKIPVAFIRRWMPQIDSIAQQYPIPAYQDTLHFLGFLILTLVALTFARKLRIDTTDVIFKMVLFSFFTEIIQRHSIERSSSMVDIVIDISGIAIGILIFHCIYRWRDRELA